MHHDFRLIERSVSLCDDKLAAVRDNLRSTWELPTDTFITADIPLLLTLLSRPPVSPNT